MVEYAESWANSGKLVVIAALDGTWQRQPFHSILQLIPLAEDVCKLKAVCSTCQQDAAFTKRLTKEIELQVGLKAALLICKLGYSLQWFGVCAASGQPLLQCPNISVLPWSSLLHHRTGFNVTVRLHHLVAGSWRSREVCCSLQDLLLVKTWCRQAYSYRTQYAGVKVSHCSPFAALSLHSTSRSARPLSPAHVQSQKMWALRKLTYSSQAQAVRNCTGISLTEACLECSTQVVHLQQKLCSRFNGVIGAMHT